MKARLYLERARLSKVALSSEPVSSHGVITKVAAIAPNSGTPQQSSNQNSSNPAKDMRALREMFRSIAATTLPGPFCANVP
jgi:hypothetical protein